VSNCPVLLRGSTFRIAERERERERERQREPKEKSAPGRRFRSLLFSLLSLSLFVFSFLRPHDSGAEPALANRGYIKATRTWKAAPLARRAEFGTWNKFSLSPSRGDTRRARRIRCSVRLVYQVELRFATSRVGRRAANFSLPFASASPRDERLRCGVINREGSRERRLQ